jgi:hypothetical protein
MCCWNWGEYFDVAIYSLTLDRQRDHKVLVFPFFNDHVLAPLKHNKLWRVSAGENHQIPEIHDEIVNSDPFHKAVIVVCVWVGFEESELLYYEKVKTYTQQIDRTYP